MIKEYNINNLNVLKRGSLVLTLHLLDLRFYFRPLEGLKQPWFSHFACKWKCVHCSAHQTTQTRTIFEKYISTQFELFEL